VEIVIAAEPIEVFPGVIVPVACVGHLAALKVLSQDDQTRPQDTIDLRSLAKVADDAEVARAREAAAIIEQRGFARGRDLQAAIAAWTASRRT